MNAQRFAITFFLGLLFLGAERAAAWDIEWVDQFGNANFAAAFQTKTDATGVYVAGPVDPALPGQSGAGSNDIFLRKYDFDGHVLWTRQFGSTDLDNLSGLGTDETGIYVAGTTFGTLPGQVSAGSRDAFVRKYGINGDVLWTHQFGTSSGDRLVDGGGGFGGGGTGIVSHSSGLYGAGRTGGTFPGQPPGNGQDFFVAKLDPTSGDVLWVRQFGVRGVSSIMQGGIGADDTGVYVATNHFPDDPSDGLLLLRKYDFDGNLVWAQQHEKAAPQCGAIIWNLAVHAKTVYVLSQEAQTFVIDHPESCQIDPGPTVGALRAYDSAGNLLWTRKIKGGTQSGNDGFTGAKTIWASEAGVFVGANLTGSFAGHSPAGPASDHAQCAGAETGSSFFDSLDAYVRRYDFNGDVIWTHQFGSSVFDLTAGLGTDATSVYAAGLTNCGIVAGETFTGGFGDAFIVRFAIEPTSLSGLVQLIVGQIETLSDKERLGPGEFNSLIQHLEAALGALEGEDRPAARQTLESFVKAVDAMTRRGALSASEGGVLVTAANNVIAKL